LGVIPPDTELSEDEDLDEATIDYNAQGLPPTSEHGARQARVESGPPALYPTDVAPTSNADLVDFRMVGPDPSTGTSTQMHYVTINISSEVRKLLCPKGLTQEMQSRMLEVTPDVLTCQGKNVIVKPGSEFEIESMWNRFAGAMLDMADVQAQKIGTQARDTQWNLPSRNSLGKIKSLEDAMELADELASNRTTVLDCAKNNYMEVLFTAGWTIEDAKIYREQGGLTMMVTHTYDNLYALVQQIIGKAFQHPDLWMDVGQPRIDYHATQLGRF
jgi:hypothetical protein